MKEKLKSASFWLTVSGGIILLLQAVGIKIDAPAADEALTMISGALIVAGILKKDVKKGGGNAADSPIDGADGGGGGENDGL
ncbi:MAG: hypothetical protein LBQ40_07515 [Clostridiales bacterium]|jgi:uncharacterized membrane protein|nr:hypothetical protein [Clostridiales bacterium]